MTRQVFVRKSDKTEKFNNDKIINSLLNVGLQASLAVSTATEIFEEIKNNVSDTEIEISSKEIRAKVYEKLKGIDNKLADKYLQGNTTKVRTSLSTFEDFDANKITRSLIEETDIDEKIAERISKTVKKQMGKLNLEFVTAPLIREMVCVELLKAGFENERKLYTRLGMPVYDVTFLIEHGSKENANLQFNPETIHKLMADQISKEYSLIKVLPLELADAHMRGEIHIHDLDYYALRPFCFSHDIRFFLKHGLKVDGVGNHTAVAGPAKKPDVAFLHAAKVLASAQVNCAGGQGFSYFNTFLAPYITGLPYEKVKQLAQMFIYEMSMMYVARGGQTVFSSIDCDMEVPEQFKDIPAVLPGGIVKENTTYADFEDETKTLFNAIVDVYLKGDYTGKAFNFPKFEVQLYPKKMDKNEDVLLKVSELAAKFGTPYYIINQPYMPLYACYQSLPYDEKVWIIKGEELHLVRIGEYINKIMDEEMKEKGHINLVRGFEGEVEIAESQDYVLSFNPKTLKIEKKKIGKVMRHPKKEEIIRFHLAFNKDITVTSNHKLIVEEKGKIIEKRAKDIKPGARLIGIRNMKKVIEELKLKVFEYEDKNAKEVYKEVGASWYTNLMGSNVTLKSGKDSVSIYHTLDRFGYDYAFSNLAIYEVRTIEFVIKGGYVYDFADVEDYHNFTNVHGIFSSNCCAFLMPLSDANTEDDVRDGTVRGGALQVVTINLPQIAYESNRDENKFIEILKDRMEKAKSVHILKREIIKKNQNLGMLPFMSQIVNEKGDKYLEVDRQSFVMGLVGMNECVKFMTGYELHEDTGWKFGLKVMNKMKKMVADIRKETGLNFSLARTPAESSAYRLAQIDRKRFPDKFITNGEGKDAYYTNSFHIRPSANIPLWKRLSVEGSFHPLTDGGAMSHIWLGEQNPDPEAILSLTKKIATKTAIQYMAFTKDLTVCSNCNFVTGGLHNKCPNCNSENVEWWSRITGYYQNIKGWNKGKLKELQDRRRYEFENNDKITAKEISFTMKEGDYEARFEKLKEKLKYDTSLDF